jgi:beta-glucosidase
VPERDLTRYDVDKKLYVVDPGTYEMQVGASSSDIRVKSPLVVKSP